MGCSSSKEPSPATNELKVDTEIGDNPSSTPQGSFMSSLAPNSPIQESTTTNIELSDDSNTEILSKVPDEATEGKKPIERQPSTGKEYKPMNGPDWNHKTKIKYHEEIVIPVRYHTIIRLATIIALVGRNYRGRKLISSSRIASH
jgi:hypothetical protein